MEFIETLSALEQHYGVPGEAATVKVAARMTPAYRSWISRSRFCVLTTVGPDGTDGSPRGDDRPVVEELDPGTLVMPDWRGNDRIDSLRNIVEDGRLSLMFFVPGSDNVVRVNGRGRITADTALRTRFERDGKLPRTAIVIEIHEIYCQCARALLRSRLWQSNDADGLPSVGDILREMTEGKLDGAAYDAAWPARAAGSMW